MGLELSPISWLISKLTPLILAVLSQHANMGHSCNKPILHSTTIPIPPCYSIWSNMMSCRPNLMSLWLYTICVFSWWSNFHKSQKGPKKCKHWLLPRREQPITPSHTTSIMLYISPFYSPRHLVPCDCCADRCVIEGAFWRECAIFHVPEKCTAQACPELFSTATC